MPARRANVLLVDDQADNLVALAAVLEPLGHNLVKASSGEEALKLLLKQDFAVILLDVSMPGLDGFETARLIKDRERTRHVPIIFVTGMSKDTEHIFRGYTEGAVDYLLKPYDPAVLRSKVAVFTRLSEQTMALEASEQRFRTAFANAPGGMALVSAEGRIVQANRALAETLGRELGELEGTHWNEVIHPDARGGDRDALAALLAGGYDSDQRFLHADGRELLMSLRVSPLQHTEHEPAQVIVQLEDVTERKRAELERAERLRQEAARAEAEAVAKMVRDLQHVSDAALAHLALDDLLPELVGRIGEILRADGVSILLTGHEPETLVPRAAYGVEGAPRGASVAISRASLAGRVGKERRPIVIHDLQAEESDDLLETEFRHRGVRSLVAVPLVSEGQVGGVLRLASRTPRFFDDDAVALLRLVADRAALAIGNARLYDREHRIAETLQRSLLPSQLPRLPGIAIAARYMPGGADVGGDWYDAIALDDGSIGVAMGDVVGHGIEAAALMGELRNSLRAFAIDEPSPRIVVAQLDRLVKRLSGDQMATLMYAVIDPAEGVVRYTSAGHPPPIILKPDGGVEVLWGGRSPLLGLSGYVEFEEGEDSFDDGSALTLYTDGLVEVPGEDLDVGLARLRDAVASAPAEPEALCDHVIEQMRSNGLDRDDVALLALRSASLGADLFRLEIPADSTSLRHTRRLMMRWLNQTGASREESEEIQLACHEACMNAVEHAHRSGQNVFELEAGMAAGCVMVTVRDAGGWRESRPERDGKGIELMHGLMDHVNVETGGDGTVVELRKQLGGTNGTSPDPGEGFRRSV